MLLWVGIAVVVLGSLVLLKPKQFTGQYKLSDFANVDYKKVDVTKHLPPKSGTSYAVIGTGFLGTNIISLLLARGEKNIKAIDLIPSKKFAGDSRVTIVQANVLDYDSLKEHLKGVEVVYATFAVIKFAHRLTHEYKLSHDINVVGTENVIRACKECDVKYLIQTSTSYVAIGYDQGKLNMDEKDGHSKQPFHHYSKTKAIAEELVLAANNSKTKGGKLLTTGAIRPCSMIFGHGDVLCSEVLALKVTSGFYLDQVLDYVYVENVALGHILLEAKMRTNPELTGGEVFCISHDDPLSRRQWYSIWKAFHPASKINIMSDAMMTALSHISETVQRLGKGKWKLGELDLLTPPTMANSYYSNSFSSKKAATILGYKPMYTTAEAIQKTVALYLNK